MLNFLNYLLVFPANNPAHAQDIETHVEIYDGDIDETDEEDELEDVIDELYGEIELTQEEVVDTRQVVNALVEKISQLENIIIIIMDCR
jgi:polyhydroxyalkanoate synthesis regulator phasin